MSTAAGTESTAVDEAAEESAVETVTLGRTTAPRYMTLDEFDDFPWGDDVKAELVRGEVRLSPMAGLAHGRIVRNIFRALDAHVLARGGGGGEVFGDGIGYALPALSQTNRGPDVSFIREGKLPEEAPIKGAPRAAPDLAVEVLSPSETWDETEEKVADLFAAGAAVIWIVSPRLRRVTVRTPEGGARVLDEAGTLDGAPVLPEFAMRVADVFVGVRAPAPRRRRGKSA